MVRISQVLTNAKTIFYSHIVDSILLTVSHFDYHHAVTPPNRDEDARITCYIFHSYTALLTIIRIKYNSLPPHTPPPIIMKNKSGPIFINYQKFLSNLYIRYLASWVTFVASLSPAPESNRSVPRSFNRKISNFWV